MKKIALMSLLALSTVATVSCMDDYDCGKGRNTKFMQELRGPAQLVLNKVYNNTVTVSPKKRKKTSSPTPRSPKKAKKLDFSSQK